jgi:hypothetical protein
VFELVVGKEGGSVMIQAGARGYADKRDRIIVGNKGKTITQEDFHGSVEDTKLSTNKQLSLSGQ